LGQVVDLGGLELAEKLIHDEGLIPEDSMMAVTFTSHTFRSRAYISLSALS
jgi:hypothetical protein